MVMVEYGFFVLLYIASLVAPNNQNKITFVVEKEGKKETFFLERTTQKAAPDEVFWLLSAPNAPKEKILINQKKHEIKYPLMGGEPIKITDYIKIPKNASKANAFQPSDAMLKEKHTATILKKTGNKIQIKQEKGWMETFQNIEMSW